MWGWCEAESSRCEAGCWAKVFWGLWSNFCAYRGGGSRWLEKQKQSVGLGEFAASRRARTLVNKDVLAGLQTEPVLLWFRFSLSDPPVRGYGDRLVYLGTVDMSYLPCRADQKSVPRPGVSMVMLASASVVSIAYSWCTEGDPVLFAICLSFGCILCSEALQCLTRKSRGK